MPIYYRLNMSKKNSTDLRDMSGRTGDLLSINTSQFSLQNSDSSFPPFGIIMAVIDDRGTVAPCIDISVNSITANQIDITGSIIQDKVISSSINSEDITTNTLTVSRMLYAEDICANTLRTKDLISPDINATSATIGGIVSASGNSTYLDVSSCTSGAVETTVTTATNIRANTSSITDISATRVSVPLITTTNLVARDISSGQGIFTDISSNRGVIQSLVSSDISSSTLTFGALSVSSNLTTTDVVVSNAFTFQQLNLDTIAATHIVSGDISTNTLRADSAIIKDVSAIRFDISNINTTGIYSAANIISNNIISNSINAANLNTSTLTDSGGATIYNISGTSINAATTINSTYITAVNTRSSSVQTTSVNLNGGILTYRPASGLFVNDVSASSVGILAPEYFGSAYVVNNLRTISDISNTLIGSVNLFNKFMNEFSKRSIIVSIATPPPPSTLINLNSGASMQFIVNGSMTAPVLFSAGQYSLYEIIGALNDVSAPSIMFIPVNQNGWTVRIDISNTGSTKNIADGSNNLFVSTSVPTGSLQLLNYLGFNTDISNNPFETYDLSSNGLYRTKLYDLSNSYISGTIPAITDIPNTLPTPTFDISLNDPYTIGFRITNSGGNYLSIGSSFGYYMYPVNNSVQNISNLAPNTIYIISALFLDRYNRSAPNILRCITPSIPPPVVTVSSLGIAINGFQVGLTQPYPGKTYTFRLDASGQNIPASITTTLSLYSYTGLIQNSSYSVTIYALDSQYNSYSSPVVIRVQTLPLTIQPPTIASVAGSNTSVNISWNTPQKGVNRTTSQIFYNVASNSRVSIPIGNNNLTTVTGLVGTGDISASLLFTDDTPANTIYSGITRYSYNTAFGFATLSNNAATKYILNSTTSLGVGYSFKYITLQNGVSFLNGPFSNCTFNTVTFTQGLQVAGSVTLTASVFNVPNMDTSYNVWVSPFNVPFDLSSNDLSGALGPASSQYIASGTVILNSSQSSVNISLDNSVVISTDTLILFRITAGAGTITFPTFSQRSGNPLQETSATSLAYTSGPRRLFNGFSTNGTGIICQFSLI